MEDTLKAGLIIFNKYPVKSKFTSNIEIIIVRGFLLCTLNFGNALLL